MEKSVLITKKNQLDSARPLPLELVKNLDDWFRVELTYSSNAIEGNTLTRQETALVLEKGLTVGGKTLTEHLEATNHAAALDYVHSLVQDNASLTEEGLLRIHKLLLTGIDDSNAGFYRAVPVRISGSRTVLPNPRKVPDLMKNFARLLSNQEGQDAIDLALEAHYQLVTIHPFVDGNGRTARLLMNLILIRGGYPPCIIRKRDRLRYLSALERAQTGGTRSDYNQLLYQGINRSLDIYLNAVNEKDLPVEGQQSLLKIGALAKAVELPVSTIRYYIQQGLLAPAETSQSGYQYFSKSAIEQLKRITTLKSERYTLSEIKELLNHDQS